MNHLFSSWRVTLTITLGLFVSGCSVLNSSITDLIKAEPLKAEQVMSQLPSSEQNLPISAQLIVNDEKIDLEVAKTPQQQQIGLMYRTELPKDRGMVFPFSETIVASFWMKNVNISLDIIFVRDGVVDSIARNVPPCRDEPCPIYRSQGFINQVIELPGGRAKELNIRKGDELNVVFFEE